jgi:hypothetical protein
MPIRKNFTGFSSNVLLGLAKANRKFQFHNVPTRSVGVSLEFVTSNAQPASGDDANGAIVLPTSTGQPHNLETRESRHGTHPNPIGARYAIV